MKNMQKDKYTALRTKSETTLRKLAKKYGYSDLPKNIKNVSYFGKRLSHFIEQQQYSNYDEVVKERNKRKSEHKSRVQESRKKLEKKYSEMLKELNKLRKELGNTSDVNRYLQKSSGEFNSLAELNYMMHDYKDIKGDVTFDDLLKIAKKTYGMTLEEMLPHIAEKIAPFNLNSFYDVLKYYGFTEKEIKYLVKLYNNGNYKQKDYILKALNNFNKGKERYEEMQDIPDHSIARENLKQSMEMAFKFNKDVGGNQIG